MSLKQGKAQLPDGVVGDLEVGTNVSDFFNEIFNGEDVLLSKDGLDDLVGSNWDSLTLDLHVSSLVKELGDGLSVWVTIVKVTFRTLNFQMFLPIGDIRVNMLKHVAGGLVDSDEGSVVDLSESEESQDSLDSWSEAVNTKYYRQYKALRVR